jgi:hypothetical protein
MAVQFNVKWKFKVNGKEYGSVDEMPGPVRDAYEKAGKNAPGPGHRPILSATTTKIVFNGQEYSNVDAMPADIRQMYQSIMKVVQSGGSAPGDNAGGKIGGTTTTRNIDGFPVSSDAPSPLAPESLSSRKLILGVAILVLLAGLYFLIHMGDSW